MIKYICDICKAEFDQEHWEGGYIDHNNLCSNRYCFSDTDPDSITDLVDEIVFYDNNVRTKCDMAIRLNCVMQWDNFSEASKQQIKAQAQTEFDKHLSAKIKAYDDAKKIVANDSIYALYLKNALEANL